MIKKKINTILLLLLSTSVIFSCSKKEEAKASEEKTTQKEAKQDKPKIKKKIYVVTKKVTSRNVEDTLKVTGYIEPWKMVKVSSEGSGKIIKKTFDEGSWIKKGSTILETEHETLLTQIKQAKANYSQAKASLITQKKLLDGEVYVRGLTLKNSNTNLKRDEKLMTDSVITKKQLDDKYFDRNVNKINFELSKINKEQQTTSMNTNIVNTESQLKLLNIQLGKTYIKAPISGIINKKYVEEGELINIGSPIADILQIDKVKVVGGVPEKDLKYINKGSKVNITLGAFPEKTFIGTVYYISYTADPKSRTFPIKIRLNNPENIIKPGMMAEFILVRNKFSEAIAIPRESIIQRQGNSIVFVENNGKAEKRILKLGKSFSGDVMVKEGLKIGDSIIIKGQNNLTDNQSIEVVSK